MDDFEAYYEQNRHLLPAELQQLFDKTYETLYFMYNMFKYLKDILPARLEQLMLQQYPVYAKHKHPEVIHFIKELNEVHTVGIAMELNSLRLDDKYKVDLRKKYHKFEGWREFYAMPHEADKTPESDRKYYLEMNDSEWEAFKQKEDASLLQFFNWQQQRQKEYYEVVQPVLYNSYEWLRNFEPDSWIIFSVLMLDNYEIWKCECERVEEILDFDLPLDCIEKNYDAYMPLLEELYNSERFKKMNLRNRRIAGEKI